MESDEKIEQNVENEEEEFTTIALRKVTRERLDTLKITKRETKDEIINRLIDEKEQETQQ